MSFPSMSTGTAVEALEAYKQYGSESKAAAMLGISRATFQSRLRRAKQILRSDVVLSMMHEQRFTEVEIQNGTVLVCSDVHCWPGPLSVAQNAFVWFAEHLQPDLIVINGDLFDGAKLSRFGSSNWNPLPSPQQEIKACQLFTSRIVAAAPNARRIWVPGNHDERHNRKLIESVPEYQGSPGFDLYKLFPEWTVAYRLTLNPESPGMTDIVHNWAGGIHAAYNNVLRSGVSYVTGHTHRNLTRPWADRSGVRYGVETGTLAGVAHPSAYYVAGRPVDWHAGFVLLTYRDGMLMRPEHIDVVDESRVSFRGVVAEAPDYTDVAR